MSLAQVGGTDLSRSFLSLVELGRSRISLKALAIVADRLDLPMSYFLEGDIAPRGAAAELLLDGAQTHIERNDGEGALRMLDGVEIPDSLKARSTLIRANALLLTERLREAIGEAEAGILLAQRQSDVLREAQFRYAIGTALYRMGALDEAQMQLRQVLETLRGTQTEDPALRAQATVQLGHILHSQGNSEDAAKYYSQARDLFDRVTDLDAMAAVYSALSLVYEQKNDYASALHYSKLGVGTVLRRHNLLSTATEMNNMALRFWETDDLDAARSAAQSAVERAHEAGSLDTEALAHGTLAQIYLKTDNIQQARAEAESAAEMAQGETSIARIDAWRVLAGLAEDEGDHERADELYVKTLDVLESTDQRFRYADVAVAYSKALRERGDTDRAFDLALKAAQIKSARTP